MSTETPGTSLAVRKPTALASTAYEPQSVSEGYALAKYLAGSGMLGKDIKSPEQALTVMIAGRELGFTAMQSLRAIYIVEGRVTLSADAMVALVLRSDLCEYLTLVESTPDNCTYKTKRRGQDEVVMSFNTADANKAGLKATHDKYPAIMKRHRCASNICRAVYPDVVLGMFSPEEMEEAAAIERPDPVQPLPTAQREVLDVEAVDSDGVVKERVEDKPPSDIVRICTMLGTARDDAALEAARQALSKTWPKAADAPADVAQAYKEAKERVKALKAGG